MKLLKSIVRAALAQCGFALTRLPPAVVAPAATELPTQIGKFTILIPSHNPNATVYSAHPTYGRALTRLCALLGECQPDFAAIDVGANVGDTLALMRNGWPCPCLCVEGDPVCCEVLARNLQQFEPVELKQAWLGDQPMAIHVQMEKSGWNTTLTPATTPLAGQRIMIQTLDALLANYPRRNQVKLLKCDAEGYDLKILRGARELLKDRKPVLFFEYNPENFSAVGERGVDTLAILEGLGYGPALVYDNIGRLLLGGDLRQTGLIADLDAYVSGGQGQIPYFDLAVFHRDDDAMARRFSEAERSHDKHA